MAWRVLLGRRVFAIGDVSAAAPCAGRPVPGGPRALRDIPRPGCDPPRRGRSAPVRRAGRLRAKRYGVPRRSLGGGGSVASSCAAVLRPFEHLRVAVSLVERRRCSGPSRAASRDGGRLRLIALIEEAAVIARILRHLSLATEIPASHPARAPALDVARAVLSPVEGRPSRSRAVPGATAGTGSGSTRAADRRLVWPVCTLESTRHPVTTFAEGPPVRRCTGGQTGAARLRRRTSAGQCCPRVQCVLSSPESRRGGSSAQTRRRGPGGVADAGRAGATAAAAAGRRRHVPRPTPRAPMGRSYW
jgi:hypothetical protein